MFLKTPVADMFKDILFSDTVAGRVNSGTGRDTSGFVGRKGGPFLSALAMMLAQIDR